MIRPVVVLNKNDGFTQRQTSVVNRALMAERNRWSDKSRQKTLEPILQDAIKSTSGIASASQVQSFNDIVIISFYVNTSTLKQDQEVELIDFNSEIESYYVNGNFYSPAIIEGDVSKYLLFRSSGNKIYVTSLKDESHIFYITMTIVVK